MLEQFLCPGSEYFLYINRDRMRFRPLPRDVRQQEKHSGIQHHTIEEVPSAAGRVVPDCHIEALDLWQLDWLGRRASQVYSEVQW
jgi:hypothetical protein